MSIGYSKKALTKGPAANGVRRRAYTANKMFMQWWGEYEL